MRSAGNFHPEWGYLAPAPSFVRTIRIALVATAIGAVAGAAVVVSLVERPGSNDNTIAAHALLTRAPVISSVTPQTTAPAVATVSPPQAHQPQQPVATALSPPTPAAASVPASKPSANVIASIDKPNVADGVSPPLPLPAPKDATVASEAPVGETSRVPAEADVAVAPDTAVEEPRLPAKRSVAKRHRYEPYRRQETRGRWHDNGGFGPLFRLFSFRTGSPYSSN